MLTSEAVLPAAQTWNLIENTQHKSKHRGSLQKDQSSFALQNTEVVEQRQNKDRPQVKEDQGDRIIELPFAIRETTTGTKRAECIEGLTTDVRFLTWTPGL